MGKRVLVLGRFAPYATDKGYFRAPLIADALDTLRAAGAECMVGASSLVGRQTDVPHVTLPDDITAPPYTARFAFRGAPTIARLGAIGHDEPWLRQIREFAPDLVLGLNPNSLPFARPIARMLGATLVLFELGGIALSSVFHSRGAFRPVLAEYYAPLFGGVDALISIEDSTALHATTPVARLPPDRQLHLPIPHRTWPARTREEAERLAELPPLRPGQRRVVWAGRMEKVKRPELFAEIARALLEAEGDGVQVVMVGGQSDALRWHARRPASVVMPGIVSNARLEAILQSSDLTVFTALISVAGTIFREAVASGVPVAATLEPTDLLLYTLLDVERDLVGLDPRDPRAAAEAIRAALRDPTALRRRAESARLHVEARGQSMDTFVDRVASFLASLLGLPL